MTKKRSFRLVRQHCPLCKSDDVSLLQSVINYFIVAIDVIIALAFFPLFAYKLKCKNCGHRYQVDIEKR
ncbi:MAG: hypothetical protein K9M75_11300 [Phycisphaerae bacterium]|nr:hypothetical protein [Phycisphaerae bacterium]